MASENIYRENKLKVGLEIHFQLDTGRKLFCKCPPEIAPEVEGIRLVRRLRPTQSELGQVDPAALFEFQKGVIIEYIAPENYTCLVETDEEPPHYPDIMSIAIALRIADYLNMSIVDEIHFMRKIVVDGSNTTGFQRTAVIGLNGYFVLNGKKYGVQSLTLEEEAARLIKKEGGRVVYSLDRLGIPLLEISTAPDINSPDEAVEVAKYLGGVVKSTGYKKRGLGTIRQDINISVRGGNIVEVKGVQRLDTLKRVIEYEFRRQLRLIELAEVIRSRGIPKEKVANIDFIDVTDLFNGTKSRILRNVIRNGGRVYGVRIPGFKGLLGFDVNGKTFAREILERIRFWTGIKGLFHSDELPGYGIEEEELERLEDRLNISDMDAYIIIGVENLEVKQILREKLVERLLEAFDGVPYETRGAMEDGTTFYMRPRPGMARMYPETDIPPIPIDKELIDIVDMVKVEDPNLIIKSLIEDYGLSRDMALELFDEDKVMIFKEIFNRYGRNLSPGFIYSVLVSMPKSLEREGYDTSVLNDSIFLKIFDFLDRGEILKESIGDILKAICRGTDVDRAIAKHKGRVDVGEVKKYLYDVIKTREDIKSLPREIKRKRLIGIAMSKFRGYIDAKEVVSIVEELINE